MSIEENIEVRKASDEVLDWIEAQAEEYSDEGERLFLSRIKNKINDMLKIDGLPNAIRRDSKMSDAEAKIFGNELIPFGEFRGKRIDEIPLDRLWWYADQQFVDELRRYLKSDRVSVEFKNETS